MQTNVPEVRWKTEALTVKMMYSRPDLSRNYSCASAGIIQVTSMSVSWIVAAPCKTPRMASLVRLPRKLRYMSSGKVPNWRMTAMTQGQHHQSGFLAL